MYDIFIAFRMLYSYVSHYRDNKVDGRAPMTVTYVVSGLIGDKVCRT